MAIFKTSFIPKGDKARSQAKGYIRYIQNRRGKDGAKIQRTLWGIDGKMERLEAYQMIDEEIANGKIAYKIILNFDAMTEDTNKDLYLQNIAEQTMIDIGNVVGQPVQWVAALHDDHTDLRHVHIFAMLPRKLRKHELPFIRGMVTEAALEQRRHRDLAAEKTSEPRQTRQEQEQEQEAHREEGRIRQREKLK